MSNEHGTDPGLPDTSTPAEQPASRLSRSSFAISVNWSRLAAPGGAVRLLGAVGVLVLIGLKIDHITPDQLLTFLGGYATHLGLAPLIQDLKDG